VFPPTLRERAVRLTEDIAQAMLKGRHWDHLIESALVEERLAVMAEIKIEAERKQAASEATTELPGASEEPIEPNLRLGDLPETDTAYSQIDENEIEIHFDLFDEVMPSDPPAGSVPLDGRRKA
jgi:hypothetical protein